MYKEAYKKLKEIFVEVTLLKIPWSDNHKANELDKMVSLLSTWVLDHLVAQNLLIAQIDLQANVGESID